MPGKTPALTSAILTTLLLVLVAFLSLLTQMLALNGASERQGVTVMGISSGCQGIGIILAALLASRLTNLLLVKFNWNKPRSVLAAVIAATAFGALIAFLSIIISIPAAGIS